jgi:hypothetical protein
MAHTSSLDDYSGIRVYGIGPVLLFQCLVMTSLTPGITMKDRPQKAMYTAGGMVGHEEVSGDNDPRGCAKCSRSDTCPPPHRHDFSFAISILTIATATTWSLTVVPRQTILGCTGIHKAQQAQLFPWLSSAIISANVIHFSFRRGCSKRLVPLSVSHLSHRIAYTVFMKNRHVNMAGMHGVIAVLRERKVGLFTALGESTGTL